MQVWRVYTPQSLPSFPIIFLTPSFFNYITIAPKHQIHLQSRCNRCSFGAFTTHQNSPLCFHSSSSIFFFNSYNNCTIAHNCTTTTISRCNFVVFFTLQNIPHMTKNQSRTSILLVRHFLF